MAQPRSKDTLRIQKALKAAGFDPGGLDGKPGPNTSAALLKYQKAAAASPQGIDVSKWQSNIDWHKVREEGKEAFAYCKASEGLWTDAKFSQNWHGIKAASLLRGAYCFFRPSLSLTAQADHLFKLIGVAEQGDLPVWIDVERDDKGADKILGTKDDIKATDAQIEAFADLLEERIGMRPAVYSYGYYLDDRDIEVPSCGLAIADYRSGPPTLPPGWNKFMFHQYLGDKGTEPGVDGPCDQVRFNGSYEELAALAGL
jgi:lysozyme